MATTPAPAPADGPQRCRYCGAPADPGLAFCRHCGEPSEDETREPAGDPPPILATGDLIQKKAPGAYGVFWTYLIVVVAVAVLSLLLGPSAGPRAVLIIGTVLLFAVTCVLSAMYWKALIPQLRRAGLNRLEAWAGLAMLIPLLAFQWAYMRSLTAMAPDIKMLSLESLQLSTAALVLLIAVFPAVMEEVAFRGLVQHWLTGALKPWTAIAIASALFTALHLSYIMIPYLFAVGCWLGWMRLKTGSLYPSMLGHFLHNYAVIALMPLLY
jgi:uncharacterized protein